MLNCILKNTCSAPVIRIPEYINSNRGSIFTTGQKSSKRLVLQSLLIDSAQVSYLRLATCPNFNKIAFFLLGNVFEEECTNLMRKA